MKIAKKQILKKLHLYEIADLLHEMRKDGKKIPTAFRKNGIKPTLAGKIDVWRMELKGYTLQEYIAYRFFEKTKEERLAYLSEKEDLQIRRRYNDISGKIYFADKWETYQLFNEFFRREAIAIGDDPREIEGFMRKHPRCVFKPRRGAKGIGVHLVTNETAEELIELARGINGGAMLEECIRQDPYIGSIHPDSVNTLRVTTFRLGDRTEILQPTMRLGVGSSFVDNAGSGGLLLAIDTDTGAAKEYAYHVGGDRYTHHPDSGVRFADIRVPRWDEMCALARALSVKVPGVQVVGWDLALSEDGWVIVEGNSSPGIAPLQLSGGPFREAVMNCLKNMN